MSNVTMTGLPMSALADIEAAASAATREAAEAVRTEAARVLARYGLEDSVLAASLTLDEEAGDALVIADAPHARYVEFGTRVQPARPFLGVSLEILRALLTAQIGAHIADALAKLERKI